jgi:hypothetical protein
MKHSLEEIIYGNPTRDQLEYLQKKSEYDSLLPEMFQITCPSNVSTLTQDELKALVEYQKEYNYLPEAVKKRYSKYDSELDKSIINYVYNLWRWDITDLVEDIMESTKPLLLKLKYKYQRPRPYQLAYEYKQSVFPIITSSALSPSFPSGHSFQAQIIANTISSINPKVHNDMNKLVLDVNEQRLFYGVHYPSDIDNAKTFAQILTTSKEWTTKYNI